METVTVVVPVHNEEATIGRLLTSFNDIFKKSGYSPKFVVVNDGSSDGTLDEIIRLKGSFGYPVRVINLEFNVGQHPCLLIGTRAVGETDYVVITDADLQNPPELAVAMMKMMKDGGFNIVYGLRRDSRLGNGFLSKIFWLGVYALSLFRIPMDQTPLKVFDSKFLKDFNSLGSYSYTFFPYNLARVRAKVGFFPVPTVSRVEGRSSYNLLKKLELYAKASATVLFGYGRKLKYRIKSEA